MVPISRRKKTNFEDSARLNNLTYYQYLNRLTELAISVFEWKNLPDTVDARYLEMELFQNASVIYFNEPDIGDLCLDVVCQGNFDVYGYPVRRRAYSRYNNFQRDGLTDNDSVIIWNNKLRTNSYLDVEMFARRLYNIDRIIDVNVNAQKTPILIQGSEQYQLTLRNLFMKYDGNQPVIFGTKGLDANAFKVLKTDAPFVSDKLYQLKVQYWNEALTYLGISNVSYQKRERMVSDEVTRGQGGTVASRNSRLDCRKEAVKEINRIFGTNIEVDFRDMNGQDLSMPNSRSEVNTESSVGGESE